MSRRQNSLPPTPNREHGNWASLIGSAATFRDNGYPQECKESLLMAIRILFQWRLRESEKSHSHCRLEDLSILADRLKAHAAPEQPKPKS